MYADSVVMMIRQYDVNNNIVKFNEILHLKEADSRQTYSPPSCGCLVTRIGVLLVQHKSCNLGMFVHSLIHICRHKALLKECLCAVTTRLLKPLWLCNIWLLFGDHCLVIESTLLKQQCIVKLAPTVEVVLKFPPLNKLKYLNPASLNVLKTSLMRRWGKCKNMYNMHFFKYGLILYQQSICWKNYL